MNDQTDLQTALPAAPPQNAMDSIIKSLEETALNDQGVDRLPVVDVTIRAASDEEFVDAPDHFSDEEEEDEVTGRAQREQSGSQRTDSAEHDDEYEDEDEDEDEEEGERNPDEPRRPRRAEIDPSTMSEDDREELKRRVLTQVDFYFGDAHYPKDQFMLQQAAQDPEGWIELPVIMKFKKMRRLTNFAWFVAETMQDSTVVQVNPEKTKLRRIAPVPKDLEAALTRTVLVENFPLTATAESLRTKYAAFGPIEQVRILRPREAMPDDVNKYIMKGYRAKIPPALSHMIRPVALVEFEAIEDAMSCCRYPFPEDWRNGVRLSILYRKSKPKKATVAAKTGSEGDKPSEAKATTGQSPPVKSGLNPFLEGNRARASSFGGFSRAPPVPPMFMPPPYGRPMYMMGARANPMPHPLAHQMAFDATNRRLDAHSPRNTPVLMRMGSVEGRSGANSPNWRVSQDNNEARRTDSPTRNTESPTAHWRPDSPAARRTDSPSALNSSHVLRQPKGPEGPSFGKGRGQPIDPSTAQM